MQLRIVTVFPTNLLFLHISNFKNTLQRTVLPQPSVDVLNNV
jgi:hypothetical protein